MTVSSTTNTQPSNSGFVSSDLIRARFATAMSTLYKTEVPLYGDLLELVADANRIALDRDPSLTESLASTGELSRIDAERHGAIRVGTAEELSTLRRLFAVMGMFPVGYYDLSTAGVPVHSTAFRPVSEAALQQNPFRVFTSLLRLELIEDSELRELANETLNRRQIFTPKALALIEQSEQAGGLIEEEAEQFVLEALETFRWHQQATVSAELYERLNRQHRLIADVVAFKGPHINHLTPRTLDIDQVQAQMPTRGINPKAVIEGPPPRKCPILLRQTSFKALQEEVSFVDSEGRLQAGKHTARFGEIEQRGAALTEKGRALYDQLLNQVRDVIGGAPHEGNAQEYAEVLAAVFSAFPDDYEMLRQQELAWFHYSVTELGLANRDKIEASDTLEGLVQAGYIRFDPLVYEDFLPVSAAGIFQSNLGDDLREEYRARSSQAQFQQALGSSVLNELELYRDAQQNSLQVCAEQLGLIGLFVAA
ncbi:VOC family protein [Nitrincola alkalilacustris]|uniref:2-oxoadipate dioxygenase/decarboxylase HglS n=1 Tax=Nitrincola alkalilacustris TaxID=1571224 RepID=UPI00124F0E18|nr:VOC family protein [Nitrincola alkalilacustris]